MRTRLWKRLVQPTLMRRMLLGQMLLLAVLWTLLVGLVIYDGESDRGLLNANSVYNSFITAADSLADQPDRRNELIRSIDHTLQFVYNAEEPNQDPEVGLRIEIAQSGKVVYRSEHMPDGIRNTKLDVIEKIDLNGKYWHTISRQSSQTGTRVTIAQSPDMWSITSRGFYCFPLVISLPLLLLPAWLAIRIGLKPWSRVAREVAERGPQDLTPLSFRPKHLELRSMVDNINMLLARVNESALRERSFTADAAHELRTPLAAMRINVEALQRQQHNAAQRGLLDGILNSSDRATRLVSQLLQMR